MIPRLILAVLAAAVLLSALAVVFSTYESRKQFVALQMLQKERDEMNIQWGRLQLEQSTWATHGRIEQVASDKLEMIIPPPGAVVIVRP